MAVTNLENMIVLGKRLRPQQDNPLKESFQKKDYKYNKKMKREKSSTEQRDHAALN